MQKKLRQDAEYGEQAEQFALKYESIRLKELDICKAPLSISGIDVMAGYDMISYEGKLSERFDRFIEVKAVSKSGFFWSRNEYETAKKKGDHYYLYLVDLRKINEIGYVPEIIKNPVMYIMEANEWYVEAQSYHLKRL